MEYKTNELVKWFNQIGKILNNAQYSINKQNFGDTFYIANSITENDDNVRVYVNGIKEVILWLLFMRKFLKRKSKVCK